MRAVVWHGKEDVRVDDVAEPSIQEPTDAIVRITSTGICGSDLHLYAKLGPVMTKGDIIGHEPMGIVEEAGSQVTLIKAGDRVVVPFSISCGHCFMCIAGMHSQYETTQNRATKKGASLFGYTRLYGAVPGGQAEFLRVPQAHFGPIKVPEGPPTTGSCTCPTSFPPRGRRWSMPKYRKVGPLRCGDSAPSVRCAGAWRCITERAE